MTDKTDLLCGRHLDQIIMCSLYGVCRVNGLKEVTFKNIIEQYRVQPQASSKVFREVNVSKDQTADVISFYNSIFIPTMEGYLLQFQSNGSSNQHDEDSNQSFAMSPNRYVTSIPPNSPKVITNMNLYLSPMRSTRPHSAPSHSASSSSQDTSTSNNPKFLFSVGESPARVQILEVQYINLLMFLQDLHNINDSLNSPRKGKPRKLLFTESSSDDGGENIAKLHDSSTLKRKHEELGLMTENDGGKSITDRKKASPQRKKKEQ